MSTVTLSKPHCAITSAEKPDGIASQALTQALPDFSRALSLFIGLSLCWGACAWCDARGRRVPAREIGGYYADRGSAGKPAYPTERLSFLPGMPLIVVPA